jgi:AcrR family transcriptional regulator
MASTHPTKVRLIETTADIISDRAPQDIQVDEILEKSGISKGSLYHHFEDLNELLEAAQVLRYSLWVDRSIAFIVPALSASKTREDVIEALRKTTEYTQSPDYRSTRIERARTIANSQSSSRFQVALGTEQARLTAALQDLVSEAQNKGLFKKELDPRVVAVFIQSYTLGKIVDDIVPEPMSPESWNNFILYMLENTLLA